MNTFFQKCKWFFDAHKKASIFAIALVAIGGYVAITHKSAATVTTYALGTPSNQTIIATVTGSGQISASSQVDLQAKADGTIISLPVQTGSQVASGALIAHVSSPDADLALQSANLAYQKFVEPADSADVSADQDAVAKAYNDAWNSITTTFTGLPDIISGMKDLFYSGAGYLSDQNLSANEQDPIAIQDRNAAGQSFDAASREADTVLTEYNALGRASDHAKIQTLLSDTVLLLQNLTISLKNTGNTLTYIATHNSSYNPKSEATSASDVTSWLNTANADLSSVIASQSNTQSAENALSKLLTGPDPLDVAAQKVSLQQKQNTYNDTYTTAPFAGVIAKLSVNLGDTVTSGTTIATLISNDKIADITLNEVDVAKIKQGDKATLTLDAIDGLSLTGTVASIDLVGTVSQGVVSYDVKISLDTDDPRVKSGMTVSAEIQSQIAVDVLAVPNSAIKTVNGSSTVQVVTEKVASSTSPTGVTLTTPPQRVPVEVGISDDTYTQIISGITATDTVVTKVNTGTATKAPTTAAPSLIGGARAGGAAGRNVRFGG